MEARTRATPTIRSCALLPHMPAIATLTELGGNRHTSESPLTLHSDSPGPTRRSRLLHEAKYDAFYGSQGPLPERVSILLCFLDGAERRHSLRMRWSGQARAPAIGRGRKSREEFS
jgi:hypothetical protein